MSENTAGELCTVPAAFDQLEKCGYECQGGPLESNIAYRYLRDHLMSEGPDFLPGQRVWYFVEAEAHGIKMGLWAEFRIAALTVDSTSERRIWKYWLSNDMPGAYHYGSITFQGVSADKLRTSPPQ